jgi:hypothetical protein
MSSISNHGLTRAQGDRLPGYAAFPAIKTITDFDFTAQPHIDGAQTCQSTAPAARAAWRRSRNERAIAACATAAR